MMIMVVAPRQGRARATRSIVLLLVLSCVALQLGDAAAAAGKARPATAASSLLHTTKPQQQQQKQQRPAAKQSNGTASVPAAATTPQHHQHQAATSEAGQLFLLGGLLQPLNALAQWAQAVGSILTGGVLGGGSAGQLAEQLPPPATKKQKKQKGSGGRSKQPTVASRPTLGVVPMCEWRADYGACDVHRQWYLTLPGAAKPGSYVAQLLTGASARDLACSRLVDPAACLDAPEDLRCAWALSGSVAFDTGCRSQLMAEWTSFATQVAGGKRPPAQAAAGLTALGEFACPGSLASKAARCGLTYPMDDDANYAPGLCAAAAPGCAFQRATNSCTTTGALSGQLATLRAADVGVCATACYLRVLASCPLAGRTAGMQLNGTGSATGRAAKVPASSSKACWAARGCTWVGGRCAADLFSSKLGPWGLAATKAWEVCQHEATPGSCAAAGAARAAPLQQRAVWDAQRRPMVGHGMADAKCSV